MFLAEEKKADAWRSIAAEQSKTDTHSAKEIADTITDPFMKVHALIAIANTLQDMYG